MWWRKALRALGLLAAILLGAPAALWAQGDYLDVSISVRAAGRSQPMSLKPTLDLAFQDQVL